MLPYNPRDLPFHARFLDLLWNGNVAALLDDLQDAEPRWPKRKTWTEGGCFILATGVGDWMLSSSYGRDGRLLPHGLRPLLSTDFSCALAQMRESPRASTKPLKLAVWESWDATPYHMIVALGDLFLDGDGLGDCDSLLTSWEDYFRGGAYLGPLSQQDARAYGIPQADALSLRIAQELRRAFGPFHPDLLLAPDRYDTIVYE